MNHNQSRDFDSKFVKLIKLHTLSSDFQGRLITTTSFVLDNSLSAATIVSQVLLSGQWQSVLGELLVWLWLCSQIQLWQLVIVIIVNASLRMTHTIYGHENPRLSPFIYACSAGISPQVVPSRPTLTNQSHDFFLTMR